MWEKAQRLSATLCGEYRGSLRFWLLRGVTLLNFSATSMARSGVALLVRACYLDDIESPLRCCDASSWGWVYETRSSVLRGVGVCGGSLDL